MIHVCLEKKIAIKATQVHIKVKIMYFYLLLFFSKAIFWGEDWDPQKMLGTPIWSDMWVPGPRMKNPSAIPAAPGRKEGRPLAVKKKADKITSISPTRAICTLPRLEINQEIDDRPRLSHEKRLVEECEIQGNKQQQKTQLCAPC